MAEPEAKSSMWSVIGWAAYLACSWTWCIGMFLPVLLIRDYGMWGFVAFAVPNVLGAAAMGWVLRRPGASEAVVRNNAGLIRAFSAVTMCFQAFFLGWMTQWVNGGEWDTAVVGFAVLAAASLRFRSGILLLGACVWLFSAATALWNSESGALSVPRDLGLAPALALMTPVMCFGFVLCPYLDATFHRVRRSLGLGAGVAAFLIGFCVLFFVMILYTAAYGGSIANFQYTTDAEHAPEAWIFCHIAVQLAFTVYVHARELALPESRAGRPRRIMALALVLALVLGASILIRWGGIALESRSMSLGEIVYRCFMAFYGLVFPAYVWLCMIPTPDGHSGIAGAQGRRRRNIWLATVGVAAPMFWMGFIERQEVWLVPGLAIVLAARAIVGGFGRLGNERGPDPGGVSAPGAPA